MRRIAGMADSFPTPVRCAVGLELESAPSLRGTCPSVTSPQATRARWSALRPAVEPVGPPLLPDQHDSGVHLRRAGLGVTGVAIWLAAAPPLVAARSSTGVDVK